MFWFIINTIGLYVAFKWAFKTFGSFVIDWLLSFDQKTVPARWKRIGNWVKNERGQWIPAGAVVDSKKERS